VIPRRLRKFAAVVAGALVAGVPVATIQHGIDAAATGGSSPAVDEFMAARNRVAAA
jgi:hypothetical protein